MTATERETEDFIDAYIECALWSSNDESRDDGGDPLDDNHGPEDLAPSALASMRADCVRFLAARNGRVQQARSSGPRLLAHP